jgi:outer membrane protein assembly factor BamE (lipoprotein component of BamABCDE complex)
MLNFQTLIITIFLAISISGCKTINVHGNYLSDDQVKEIIDKKPTKDEIIHIIGSPTLTPDYSSNTWYYASRSVKRQIFSMPQIVAQRIVKVQFNQKDKMISAEILEDSYAKNIVAISDHTKACGNDENAIQQFVRNIGRFNKNKNKNIRHGTNK